MNYYCTLFDSNYLTRGLAMYHSLVYTGEKFHLYVIAFDDLAYMLLRKMALPHTDVISLTEFENDRLLAVKKTRTGGEYCWTCTSFSILYILEHYKIAEVTYLDADLYFFAAPGILLEEFHDSGGDVMLTKHRYTGEYDQSATSGIYCVQFMTFKNNKNSLKVLNWWCDRCAEWCYARMEAGKFGDQKYLDDWTDRFMGIYVLENIGGGVAPWNIQQYAVSQGPNINGSPIIFYHFHGIRWFKDDKFDLNSYRLNPDIIRFIYWSYINALKKELAWIREVFLPEFDKGFCRFPGGILNRLCRLHGAIVRKRKHVYNVFQF